MGRRLAGTGPVRPGSQVSLQNGCPTPASSSSEISCYQDHKSDTRAEEEGKLLPGWQEAKDPVSNDVYFWNEITGSVTWDRPICPVKEINGDIVPETLVEGAIDMNLEFPQVLLDEASAQDEGEKEKQEDGQMDVESEIRALVALSELIPDTSDAMVEVINNAISPVHEEPPPEEIKDVAPNKEENDLQNSIEIQILNVNEPEKNVCDSESSDLVQIIDETKRTEAHTAPIAEDDLLTCSDINVTNIVEEPPGDVVVCESLSPWDLQLTEEEVGKLKTIGVWMFWQDLMWLLKKGPGMKEQLIYCLRGKLEARIEDWRDGGISDEFLISRIRQMAEYDFENDNRTKEKHLETKEHVETEENNINVEKECNEKSSTDDKTHEILDEGILEFMSEIEKECINKDIVIDEGVEEFMKSLEEEEEKTVQCSPEVDKPKLPSTPPIPTSLAALVGGYGDGSSAEEEEEAETENEEDTDGEVEQNPLTNETAFFDERKTHLNEEKDSLETEDLSVKAAALSAKAASVDERFAELLASATKKKPVKTDDERLANVNSTNQEVGNDSKDEPVSTVAPSIGELPAGWEAHWDDEESRYYYFNPTTQESTWELPKHEQDEIDLLPSNKKQQIEIEPIQDRSVLLFSPAGDLWKGHQISSIFEGCGERHFRALGQGYYMMSFQSKDITARGIVMAAEHGVSALEEAQREWTKCKRDVFIRYVTPDDPMELYELHAEIFNDALASDLLTQTVVRGPTSTVLAKSTLYKTAACLSPAGNPSSRVVHQRSTDLTAESSKTDSIKQSITSKLTTKGVVKKGKLDKSLINKWKKVAKNEERESNPNYEKKKRMSEWKSSMLASGAAGNNPNFAPVGAGTPGAGEKMFKLEHAKKSKR